VTCKCRMKMENRLLKDHEASACPLRPTLCQYCDIQLPSNKLQYHEVYCGARTETCGGCGHNVMVKDLKEHPRVCGQGVKQARGSRTVPRFEDEDGDLRTLRGTGTRRRAEEELEQSERDENARSALHDEWSADLDYALALSLQHEDNPHGNTGVPQDLWENCRTTEPVPSACLNEMDTPNTFSWDSSGSFSASNHIK
ncbi:PREDICTED: TRAF-type zinc finger domain-containing protein 1, partial [Buceros rhinoceros silvestris]|uniref:TRAF-type zinc finger domain-containing protein 1 n=1 Tax=Buceros rhinoceros silvestris TaxID=175836 RepID=UPI000528D62B